MPEDALNLSDDRVEVGTADRYEELANELLAGERRFSNRIVLNLLARCMLADGTELPALLADISPLGLALQCARRGAVDEPVIIYIDYLGRFEGRIVRLLPSGFAVNFNISHYRRESLIAVLDALSNPEIEAKARHNVAARARLAVCDKLALAKRTG